MRRSNGWKGRREAEKGEEEEEEGMSKSRG